MTPASSRLIPMKQIIIAVLALLAAPALNPALAFTGREGFCEGEPNFKECVNANRGAARRHHSESAHEACAELAEYTSRKERIEWERCLIRNDRRGRR